MRYIIFCLLGILSFSATAQQFQVFKGDTINRKDLKGLKQGTWRKYYRTDTLCSETFFVNDKPVGISRTWYESGKLKAEVVFGKNSLKGKGISYYENGKVLARGNYLGQKKDSTWIYFHEKVDTISAIENYKNGVEDGIWKTFYENGKAAQELTYLKGKKNGVVKQYNIDGALIFTMIYVNGVEEGESILYYADGKVRQKGIYKNGQREGKWLWYDKNGAVSDESLFINGVEQEKK